MREIKSYVYYILNSSKFNLRFRDLSGEGDKGLRAAVHRDSLLRHVRELIRGVDQQLRIQKKVVTTFSGVYTIQWLGEGGGDDNVFNVDVKRYSLLGHD